MRTRVGGSTRRRGAPAWCCRSAGPAGVAHIGAIAAIKAARLPIDCVVGNSMGALVGGLYVTAPGEDLDARFRGFVGAYADATKAGGDAQRAGAGDHRGRRGGGERRRQGRVAAAFVAGAALGVAATEKLEHERMVRVLDDFVHGAAIERLPIRYVTFYQEGTATGVVARKADSGPLAAAVGGSVANPLIFSTLAFGPGRPIDPGADRVSATPVQDACAAFPDANLLAINASGQPIFTDATMTCPVLEVRVDAGAVSAAEVMQLGDGYRRVVAIGLRGDARGAGAAMSRADANGW